MNEPTPIKKYKDMEKNQINGKDYGSLKVPGRVLIERKQYQDLLLRGALAFGQKNEDVSFNAEMAASIEARQKFSHMLMEDSDGHGVQSHILYLFQASAKIEQLNPERLNGLASGYLVTLWRTSSDEELKRRIAKGILSLLDKKIISEDEVYNPADFVGDGSTEILLDKMLTSAKH